MRPIPHAAERLVGRGGRHEGSLVQCVCCGHFGGRARCEWRTIDYSIRVRIGRHLCCQLVFCTHFDAKSETASFGWEFVCSAWRRHLFGSSRGSECKRLLILSAVAPSLPFKIHRTQSTFRAVFVRPFFFAVLQCLAHAQTLLNVKCAICARAYETTDAAVVGRVTMAAND